MITSDGDPGSMALLWMRKIWSDRDLSRFEELHSVDFVDRSSSGRQSDRAAYCEGILELFNAFPDFQAEVEDLIVEPKSGKAVIRWSAKGTHMGPFQGLAGTGRRISFQGIEIIRVSEGKILERWGEWDGFALLDQLRGSSEVSTSFGEET